MKQEGKITALNQLSVYDVDIFQDILTTFAHYLPVSYPSRGTTDLDLRVAKSYRIVADHLRTAVFLVHEGLTPSNEGR